MPLTKILGGGLSQTLSTASNITASGNTIFTGNTSFQNFSFYQEGVFEKANVISDVSGANIVVNLSDSAGIVYYTGNATANVTVNFTGIAGVQQGNVASAVVILTNNTNPKYISTIQVEGTAVAPKWQGGAPTSGTANIDVYSFNVIKTGASSYTVLGQVSNFR